MPDSHYTTQSSEKERRDSGAARQNLAILLIEDRESLRAMLAETLTHEGYAVEAVATGDEGVRRLAEGRRYALVLTDLKLPGADGLAVLKAARESDPALPVVLLTGFGTIENAV